MEKIIEIKHLNKRYGSLKAVDDLSFQARTGELFAFLGVNGAGKSTTIHMLCGQLKKDSGDIFIDGLDITKHKKEAISKLGVVFQDSVLDGPLSVYENLRARAALYGILGKEFKKRLRELCDLFNLDDLLDRSVQTLSGGQRRRIDVARALIHRPKILILDEPTTGLDPQTRKMLWDVIHSLRRKEKMTVFLTTHYMEEAANADYIVILDHGKIVAEGTPLELKNAYTKDFLYVYHVKEEDIQILNLPYIPIRDGYRMSIKGPSVATALILKHPDLFQDYEITKGKMDDVFLSVTGHSLEEK